MFNSRNIVLLICFGILTYVTVNLVIKNKPLEISSLNQAVETVADAEGWVNLFNGSNLNGWEQKTGAAIFDVSEGNIKGTSVEDSPNSFLATTKSYQDFELELEVKIDTQLNSGIQIRSHVHNGEMNGQPVHKNMPVSGPQIEIYTAGNETSYSGFIYGEGMNVGGWLTPKENHIKHSHYNNEQWNHYRIVAQGSVIQTWINGQQVSNLQHEQAYDICPNGFIALQVHSLPKYLKGQGPFNVEWRNIKIKEN